MYKKENFFVEYSPKKWKQFSYQAYLNKEMIDIVISNSNDSSLIKKRVNVSNILNEYGEKDLSLFEDMGEILLFYVKDVVKDMHLS